MGLEDQATQQIEKKGAQLAMSNPGVLAAIFGGCGCVGIGLLMIAMVGLGVFALNNEGAMGDTATSGGALSSTLSDMVPPNYAQLFSDAETASGVPASMIAALYLTEHHTDSFGGDLTNLDQELSPCTENGSGAAGPMQFIPGSWSGVTDDLITAGIASPNRCRYRDSIIGAGFLLKGKFTFDWVQETCTLDASGGYLMTDECISRWGQSYCGVPRDGNPNSGCNSPACGAPGYLYCEEVVRKYHLVIGGA